MNARPRKIIHVDMDCFYAAIEVRDRPGLRGRPVAVGGSADRRGVVCTCNYEARAYGVRSAMAMATAVKLCPGLEVLPVAMEKYQAESRRIHQVFRRYTPLIEPLSLDEAYLDVSAGEVYDGSATRIAEAIRREIRELTGLTASAGVAANKFLAKVASDWRKPDGLFVVPPEAVDDFIRPLPVEKIFGVGKVTAERLHSLGIRTCGELQEYSQEELLGLFGSFGVELFQRARGIDDREVIGKRERKSLSVEETFERDLPDLDACLSQLPPLFEDLCRRLAAMGGGTAIKSLFVKIKDSDFNVTTSQCPAPAPDLTLYGELLRQRMSRLNKSVRLLGLGVHFADAQSSRQLLLPLRYTS